MQKSKKTVLISSVLKPVNDTRLYEKIGRSLTKHEYLDIHICGFKSSIPNNQKITFHPIFFFKRLSIWRFLSYWKYAILIIKVKPNIIICNTFELQIINITYKILFGAEYYYNLEENYYRNIRYTSNFNRLFRTPFSLLIRLKEKILHPFVTQYLSAENCYLDEMPFIKEKTTTILNKTTPTPLAISREKNTDKSHFLYTGTIAEQYGIFNIINFIKSIHETDPKYQLTIIGYCPNLNTLSLVKKEIKNQSYITLIGGEQPIDHNAILKHISQADIGIISYINNLSTENCFPTKIYEYLHYKLPIVSLTKNKWSNTDILDTAILEFDFNSSIKTIIDEINSYDFYTNETPKNIYWESEEKKLFKALRLD